jgi:hypothetical protein
MTQNNPVISATGNILTRIQFLAGAEFLSPHSLSYNGHQKVFFFNSNDERKKLTTLLHLVRRLKMHETCTFCLIMCIGYVMLNKSDCEQ